MTKGNKSLSISQAMEQNVHARVFSTKTALEKTIADLQQMPFAAVQTMELIGQSMALSTKTALEKTIADLQRMPFTAVQTMEQIGQSMALSSRTALEKTIADLQRMPFAAVQTMEQMVQSIAFPRNRILDETAFKKLQVPPVIGKTIVEQLANSIDAQKSLWEEALTEYSAQEDIESGNLTVDADIDTCIENLRQLSSASDSLSFFQQFGNLPPLIKRILLFVVFYIILPHLTNLSSSLIWLQAQPYLNDNLSSRREKVNTLKKIPLQFEGIETKSLRFISRDNVHLRKSPSTHSEIFDHMVLGQVVTVLSYNNKWIKIAYQGEDGETKIGWVFKKYTSKFIK